MSANHSEWVCPACGNQYATGDALDAHPCEADNCAICVPGQCPGPDCVGNKDSAEGRISSALHFARTYGQIQGDHHRAWVIEQITAVLEGRPADGSRGIAP
jgi:hypothetical protein